MFIDTHTHLYVKEFAEDIDSVIQTAVSEGVTQFYLPAIDSESHDDMLRLEAQFPDCCIAMMGLHPCSVQADTFEREMSLVESHLALRKFVAIGEIGIDLHWDKSTLDLQIQAFTTQIEWAKAADRPIVIHARKSMHEILPILRKLKTNKLRGIFHCFGSSLRDAEECIDLGFMLGIGGVVTYPKAGLETVLQHIDLQHLVLETDAPYLSPVPFRGKRNSSAYIPIIAQKIAEIKGVTVAQVAAATTANAVKTFA